MRQIISVLAAGIAFLIFMGTSEMLPLVWDEGELIERAELVKSWGSDSPFSQTSITKHWRSTTVIEGHPGGYLAIIAGGKTIADTITSLSFLPSVPPKTSWRFGTILLMSIAIGVLFSAIYRHFGWLAACFVVSTIFLVPRLFAHSHFVTCDGILTAAWMLAVATFPLQTPQKRIKRIIAAFVWGICFGLTLAAKFTGWAIIVPFAVMIIARLIFMIYKETDRKIFNIFSDRINKILFPTHSDNSVNSVKKNGQKIRETLAMFLLGGLTAAFVFYLLNPPIWYHPIDGFAEFWRLNTHRDRFNISIQFWGQMYDLHHPLPFYNTIVWIAITFPALFLITLPFGVRQMFSSNNFIETFRKKNHNKQEHHEQENALIQRNRFSVLILLNALILPIVRAFPNTPPHDGVRLFITSFAFLAVIAGIGLSSLWQKNCGVPAVKRFWKFSLCGTLCGRLFVIFALLSGVNNMIFYAPQWLSFYNAVIGGVHGAAQRGFEPTYYWDSLDSETIQWLNQNTLPDKKIYFSAKSSKTLNLVRKWNNLQPDFRINSDGDYQWYILQRRPGAWQLADRRLIKNFTPIYIKHARQPPTFSLSPPETPILYVFQFEDYVEAREERK
jgi:hypothetical protein